MQAVLQADGQLDVAVGLYGEGWDFAGLWSQACLAPSAQRPALDNP